MNLTEECKDLIREMSEESLFPQSFLLEVIIKAAYHERTYPINLSPSPTVRFSSKIKKSRIASGLFDWCRRNKLSEATVRSVLRDMDTYPDGEWPVYRSESQREEALDAILAVLDA